MSNLAQRLQELQLRFLLISFTDLFGIQRAKLVPASAVDAMARDGAGFAGFAAWLDLSPADGDVMAIPAAASLTPLPWQPGVGWVAAELQLNGQPMEQCPRRLLRRQLERAAERGLELRSGVEAEFFLLDPSGERIGDSADSQEKPCYDQLALMRRYPLIGPLLEAMEQLDWGPYQADHEDANGQFEVNWTYANALTTADRHAFFKVMVKSLAGRLVIAPPSAHRSVWMKRFQLPQTAFVSGWMAVRGARRRRGYERGFVMSDHADWPGLIQSVQQSCARQVYVTHGNSDGLARYLSEVEGISAEPLAG